MDKREAGKDFKDLNVRIDPIEGVEIPGVDIGKIPKDEHPVVLVVVVAVCIRDGIVDFPKIRTDIEEDDQTFRKNFSLEVDKNIKINGMKEETRSTALKKTLN